MCNKRLFELAPRRRSLIRFSAFVKAIRLQANESNPDGSFHGSTTNDSQDARFVAELTAKLLSRKLIKLRTSESRCTRYTC